MKRKRNSTSYSRAVLRRKHDLIGKPGVIVRRASNEPANPVPGRVSSLCMSGEGLLSSQFALMRLLWREIGTGVVISDADETIILANKAARQIAQAEPEGRSLADAAAIWGRMLDAGGREISREERPYTTALSCRTMKSQVCRMVQSSGAEYNVLWSARPIFVTAGQAAGVVNTLTDITAVKQQESMLREQAVTRERARMAADLHDTLCQGLTAIVFQLEAAEQALSHNSKAALQHLQCARETARSNLAQARRSLWTLTDDSQTSCDPARVLSVVARHIMQGVPIALSLSLQPQRQAIPPVVASELVRIGREALTNVVKHSHAKKVHVQLLYKKHALELQVADDGQGISGETQPSAEGAFGLTSMRERAERLGGTIVVDSQPGHGTRIVASLPVPVRV